MLGKEKSKTELNVVFLGEVGFPYGFASMQRLVLMAKGLVHAGVKTTVVCRKGVWRKGEHIDFPTQGNFEGIDYCYTSDDCYKPQGFFRRNYSKLVGIYREYRYLKKLSRQGKLDVAVVFNRKLFHVLRYLFFGKLFGFPVVYNLVEMASAMRSGKGAVRALNNRVLDKWVIKFFSGALPISDRLTDYYRKVAPGKPYLKVPIVCDFQKFEVEKKAVEPYFLYCGGIEYRVVIDFVVRAYKNASLKNTEVKLYMIVSGGSSKATASLQQEIDENFEEGKVKLFSNIPYAELVDLYVNARALLIPLRPTEQDASRFPHKIGEYLASGNPVVTTNIGEIKNYFTDGETAFVSDSYEEDSFAQKMEYVIGHPDAGETVGAAGKRLGLREFDYRAHGNKIKEFINSHF